MAKQNKNIILPQNPKPLQVARVQSEIKRINTRIVAIADVFGVGSDVYNAVVSKLVNVSAGQYTHLNKNGVVQLSSKISDLQTAGGTYTYNVGRKIPTLTGLKQRYGVDKKTSIQQAKQEIEQKQKMSSHFSDVWNMVYGDGGLTDSEIREVAPEMWRNARGIRKLTYGELENIAERLEEKFTSVNETPFD